MNVQAGDRTKRRRWLPWSDSTTARSWQTRRAGSGRWSSCSVRAWQSSSMKVTDLVWRQPVHETKFQRLYELQYLDLFPVVHKGSWSSSKEPAYILKLVSLIFSLKIKYSRHRTPADWSSRTLSTRCNGKTKTPSLLIAKHFDVLHTIFF